MMNAKELSHDAKRLITLSIIYLNPDLSTYRVSKEYKDVSDKEIQVATAKRLITPLKKEGLVKKREGIGKTGKKTTFWEVTKKGKQTLTKAIVKRKELLKREKNILTNTEEKLRNELR